MPMTNKGNPTGSRGLSRKLVRTCSIAFSHSPARTRRRPLTNQARAELGLRPSALSISAMMLLISAPLVSQHQGNVGKNTGIGTAQHKCLLGKTHCFEMLGLRILSVAVEPQPQVTYGRPRKGWGKLGVADYRLLEAIERLGNLDTTGPWKIR